MTWGIPSFLALISVAPPLLSGCFGLNSYATPEPVAPGQIEAAVAPEYGYFSRRTVVDRHLGDLRSTTQTLSVAPPAVLIRTGVSEGVDVGVGLKSGGALSADVKLALPSDGAVTGALLPSAQASFHGALVDLPVLVAVHAGERAQVIVSPGLSWASLWDEKLGLGDPPRGALARVGLGVRVRVTAGFSLQPEVTVAASPAHDRPLWLTGGLGMVFGSPSR